MLANRSIPSSTVIPELAYPNISEAIDWLSAAFGFTLRLRIADHRAQLTYGDGAIVLTQPALTQSDEAGELTPTAHSIMVRVDDVDAHYENAVKHGARIVRPPATYPYGERQYTAADFTGRTWKFSQTVADVDPRDWGGTPGAL